jgi:DNA-binding winged helix-turn-helix (wHTH) protein
MVTSLINKQSFYLGKWFITPDQNKLKNLDQEIFIEPKLMEVLVCLCMNAPDVTSHNKIIETCWKGQFISDNPLHKCIAQLRKVLGDIAKNPQYIKTIPKKGYSIISEMKGINHQLAENRITWHNHVPYLGLKHYTKQHQRIFFGRSKAIAEIKSLIDKSNESDLPLLMLRGLSSVGKSSLIHTAIIPYLIDPEIPFKYHYSNSLHYDITLNRSQSCVRTFLKYLINNNIFNAWLDIDKHLLQLKQSLLKIKTENVVNIKGNICPAYNANQHILFIDHFENILNEQKQNSDELDLMILLILELIKTGNYLILIASRSENYQVLNNSVVFKSIKQNILHYELLPPNYFEITEIVQKPVIAAGLRYEFNKSTFESLDKVIIDDARNMANILSILSYTLKELCENCNQQHQLTFEKYHEIGKLTGALTYKINGVLKTLSEDDKQLFADNLHYLIRFKPGEDKEYIAIETDINSFKGEKLENLIHYLINQGLLKSHSIDINTFVSLLHDSILQECAFFKQWIAKNHLKLSIVTEVKTLADQWICSDKNRDYLLYNHYLLGQTEHFIKDDKISFSSDQSQFLALSFKQQKIKSKLKLASIIMLVSLLVLSFVLLTINKKTSAELLETNNNAENLITFMIGDLKEKLRPLGKLELLEIVGDQIINYYDNRTQRVQSEQSLVQYNKALNTIGEVEFNQGKLGIAETIFKQATAIDLDTINNKELKISALFNHGQSNYWLGYISYLQSDFELTQLYWSNYLDLSEQLLSIQPDKDTWKLEKSYALNNLGSLNFQQNDFLKAKNYFDQSAQLKRDLFNANPTNAQYLAELADTVSWQANILDKRNELMASSKMYLESLNLTEKLVIKNPDNKIWQHNLALAYFRVASSFYDLGNLNKTKFYLDKSLPIYIGLNQYDNTNQTWIDDLLNNYILTSKYYRHTQNLDQAALNVKRALSLFDSYSVDSKNLMSAHIQSLYLNAELSLVNVQQGQAKMALVQFNTIINHFDEIDITKYVNHKFLKAYMLFVLAKIKTANQQIELANLDLAEALSVLSEDISSSTNKTNMALYVVIEQSLGVERLNQDMVDYIGEINYRNPDYNQ